MSRCVVNQSVATSATRSSAPGSAKRCPAPGTTTSRCGHRRSAAEPVELENLGVRAADDQEGRSGHVVQPVVGEVRAAPAETIALTALVRSAAANSAAAAPVEAPKYPSGREPVVGSFRAHAVTA